MIRQAAQTNFQPGPVNANSDLANDDAIFACDVGECSVWPARQVNLAGGRRNEIASKKRVVPNLDSALRVQYPAAHIT
jgi:thiamine pyrophosphate-dependent acetolactate synthase large subunit-like protein